MKYEISPPPPVVYEVKLALTAEDARDILAERAVNSDEFEEPTSVKSLYEMCQKIVGDDEARNRVVADAQTPRSGDEGKVLGGWLPWHHSRGELVGEDRASYTAGDGDTLDSSVVTAINDFHNRDNGGPDVTEVRSDKFPHPVALIDTSKINDLDALNAEIAGWDALLSRTESGTHRYGFITELRAQLIKLRNDLLTRRAEFTTEEEEDYDDHYFYTDEGDDYNQYLDLGY